MAIRCWIVGCPKRLLVVAATVGRPFAATSTDVGHESAEESCLSAAGFFADPTDSCLYFSIEWA